MTVTARFLRRDPAGVEPWAETCGQIRPLIEEADGAAAEVHHVEIHDARRHYREKTDVFYYVIRGQGTMVLDGEVISAPTTNYHFTNGKPQLTGNFTASSAKALANQLKYGALPLSIVMYVLRTPHRRRTRRAREESEAQTANDVGASGKDETPG